MKWTYVPVLPAPTGDPDRDRPWAELEALRAIAALLEEPAAIATRDRFAYRPGAGFPPDLDLPTPELPKPPDPGAAP